MMRLPSLPRPALALLPLLAFFTSAAAGCGEVNRTSVTVTLRVDDDALRPEHAMILWRVPGRPDRPEKRLPEHGELRKMGQVLGSVTFEVEDSIAGEREMIVTGYRQDRRVSRGRAPRVPWVKGGNQQLTLTLTCLVGEESEDEQARTACKPKADPDRSGSGAMDAGSPSGPADGGAVDLRPDRPATDAPAGSADAGPRNGSPDAGVAVEAGPARDAAVDHEPPVIEADAATLVDLRPPEPPVPPNPPNPPVGVELGRSLQVYLRFDEGGRSFSSNDGSGMGASATLINLDLAKAWITGPRGQALAFPAQPPGWVRVTGNALNALTESFTLSVWIRAQGSGRGGGRRTVIARRSIGPGGFLYSLHLDGDRPGLYINSSNGAHANFTSNESLPANQWVHLALVYDREFARLWLGGRNVGETRYQLTIPPENSPLSVGASEDPAPGTATDPLGGDLDEVAIYDRALRADEIAALARGFQPPFK